MQPRPIPDAITGPGHAPGARISVVGYVLDCIKAAIVRRELKPGDMLPAETELSARLGVGKTSIREAVKMLQAVGAVDIWQGHGTVIRTEPGPDMLSPLVFQLLLKEGTSAELLEFRKLLEPNYTLLAQRKATDADIDDLEQMVVRLEERIANGLQTVEDDLAFHRAILRITRNRYMIAIGETILELFRSSIEKSIRDIPQVAASDHRAIFLAFKSGDPERLHRAVETSHEGWTSSLRAQDREEA
jgi:GntR family transcriptional repressor for pyruvate dehydrogenase complex